MAKVKAKPVEFQAMIDGGRNFIDGLKTFGLTSRVGNRIVFKITSLLDVFQRECDKMAIKAANDELARETEEMEANYYGQKRGI